MSADHPAPSSQTAAVLGAAHRQQRQDAASSQPGSDGLCIVAAVSHHRIWTTPRPSPLALEWQNPSTRASASCELVSVGGAKPEGTRVASDDLVALGGAVRDVRHQAGWRGGARLFGR